ncbi:MAG: hypothetical protein ACE37F_04100 [Nannocystaceae bacterium]|nr:hypothetical protein [bacterium]
MPDLLDVELDDGVIVVRYDGRPDDEVFQKYLQSYTDLVYRRVPYTAVYSTLPGARIPSGANARLQAAWMKREQPIIGQYCRGLAFALPSPLMRGVLRGVLTLQPLVADHIVVDNEAEAVAWARSRLQSA